MEALGRIVGNYKMLEDKLKKYAESDIYPFHMPGHKRVALDFANPYSIDITEIEGFDNLHHAGGVLKSAQTVAAELYGSGHAYYLVNGSTCGLLAAISAAVPRGGRILVARNCHKAVYNAVYLRQLSVEYVYSTETRYGIQGQITVNQIERKLEECPGVQAVVITSPTYDGIVSNIAGIAEVVHRFGIPLIVDEAHGAHFGFHSAFPENAVKLGADVVIMSVHKTLPAFTQTALLHLCSDRVDREVIEQFLGIYETSSPSYLLMAGIEKSLSIVQEQGEELFDDYAAMLDTFRESVRDLRHLQVLGAGDFSADEAWTFDPGKLPVICYGAMSGQQLKERLLRDYGLEMEMAGGHYVLAMTSFMDRWEGFKRFSAALQEIDASLMPTGETGNITPREIYRQPEKEMEIYEAYEAQHTQIPLAEAVNRISADTVFLYPPGIPILVPGERIDRQMVETIGKCRKMGLDVQGLGENDTIRIVKRRTAG